MDRERRTGILVNDALLVDIEAFAGLVRPPLFQLAILVVESAGRVEGMLQRLSQQNALPTLHDA